MVGVVDAAAPVRHDVRIVGEYGVGPERADLTDQQFAERQVVGQCAIGLMEEGHALIADDGRGAPLLGLACQRKLLRVDVGVLASLIAAGAADEPAHRSGVDPAGGRGRGAEISVVRVRGNDHEASGTPLVGRRDRAVGHAGRAARASSSAVLTSAA